MTVDPTTTQTPAKPDPAIQPDAVQETVQPSIAQASYMQTNSVQANATPVLRPRLVGLWLMLLLVVLLLAVSSAWSYLRYQQLERLLVATQDSFAKMNEDASGHLEQAIQRLADDLYAEKTKRAAAERQLTSIQQRFTTQTSQAEQQLLGYGGQLTDLQQQQQALEQGLEQQAEAVEKSLIILDTQQREHATGVEERLAAVTTQQQHLATQLDSQHQLIQTQAGHLTALTQQLEAVGQTLTQLTQGHEQGIQLQQVVLQLKNSLQDSQALQTQLDKELSAFRAQVTRNLNQLNQQVQAVD